MGIEKADKTTALRASALNSDKLTPGRLVRVRVISTLGKGHSLVEFNGRVHHARLSESIQHRLFIARVNRIKPSLVLKFVSGLDGKRSAVNRGHVLRLLNTQKPFIDKLITTDKFLESHSVVIQPDEQRATKESLKKTLKKQSSARNIPKRSGTEGSIRKYFVLQSILNYIDPETFLFCFPLKLGTKYGIGDLKLFHGNKNGESGIFLLIHLDELRKIVFLISVNYESIVCAIGTNDERIEGLLKMRMKELRSKFEEVYPGREVEIQMVGFDEKDFDRFRLLKRIDIKM
jgi:hypothetical protein